MTKNVLLWLFSVLLGLPALSADESPLPQSAPASKPDVSSVYKEGLAALNKKNYHQAIERFRRILEIEPGSSYGHYILAFALRESGDKDGALKVAQEGMKGPSPHSLALYSIAAKLYDEAGNERIALALLREAIDEPSSSPEDLRYIGNSLLNHKDYQGCRRVFQKILYKQPDDRTSHEILAGCYAMGGYTFPMVMAASRALQLDPQAEKSDALRKLVSLIFTTHGGSKAPIDEGDFRDETKLTSITKDAALLMIGKEDQSKIPDEVIAISGLISLLQNRHQTWLVSKTTGFASSYYLPFYAELGKRHLEAPFAYFIFSGEPKVESKEWFEKHTAEKNSLGEFLKSYHWPVSPEKAISQN